MEDTHSQDNGMKIIWVLPYYLTGLVKDAHDCIQIEGLDDFEWPEQDFIDRSQISGWGIYSREVRNVVFKNGNATSQFKIEPCPPADSLTMHVGQALQTTQATFFIGVTRTMVVNGESIERFFVFGTLDGTLCSTSS